MKRDSERAAGPQPTIACRLTAAGRGAIAVIGVRGPHARTAILQCFQPVAAGAEFTPGSVVLGNWIGRTAGTFGNGDVGVPDVRVPDVRVPEKLVVGVLGRDRFEVNCHGGRAAIQRILSDLQRGGVQIVDHAGWQPQQHPHQLEAACELVLLRTSTRRTAAIALDQLRGALRRAVAQVQQAARDGDRDLALTRMQELLQYADLGLHLADPWKVALAGRPNAGKSSLMNALLGYQRAITADAPGTTRDRVTAETSIDGWPVQLVDMAGVRTGTDRVEQQGVVIAGRAIAEADLVLSLRSVDVAPIEPLEHAGRPLAVWTKSDLAPAPDRCDLAVSAKNGAGLDQLWRRIVSRLVPAAPQPAAAVPVAAWQVEQLQAAERLLRAGRFDSAGDRLDRLLA